MHIFGAGGVRRRPVWLYAVLIIPLLSHAIHAQQRSVPMQRVLVLHSYSTDLQWTRDLDRALRQRIVENTDGRATVTSGANIETIRTVLSELSVPHDVHVVDPVRVDDLDRVADSVSRNDIVLLASSIQDRQGAVIAF